MKKGVCGAKYMLVLKFLFNYMYHSPSIMPSLGTY